jgi:hypothetical protein
MDRGGRAAHEDEARDATHGPVVRAAGPLVGDGRGHDAGKDSGSAGRPRLCLCADDFGLDAAVDEAVIELVRCGRLQAVGCLVGAPGWAEGSRRLRAVRTDRVDVGLHLDFTQFPLLPGSRRPLPRLILAAITRRLDQLAVRREIAAQIARFERDMGRPPAFVDGHQHVHQLPIVRDALLALLASRDDGTRPWLRSTRRPEPAPRWPGRRWSEVLKPWLIEALGARGLARLARRHGFAQNRSLLGVYAFPAGADGYAQRRAGWLAVARDGDLLMCHPGRRTDAGSASDPIADARVDEFEVLAGSRPTVRRLDEDFALTPLSRLTPTHPPLPETANRC